MTHVQALERRQLLAAAGSVSVTGGDDPAAAPTIRVTRTGTLTILGNARKESIRVQGKGRTLTVEVVRRGGGLDTVVYVARVDARTVERLNVNAGAGDDAIVVNADVRGHSELLGGRGDDAITTTGRRTRLLGGSGDDRLTSDPAVSTRTVTLMDNVSRTVRAIDATHNVLSGSDGDDVIRTRGGEDTVDGGAGDDRFEPLENGVRATPAIAPRPTEVSDIYFVSSRVAIDGVESTGDAPAGVMDVQVRYASLLESGPGRIGFDAYFGFEP